MPEKYRSARRGFVINRIDNLIYLMLDHPSGVPTTDGSHKNARIGCRNVIRQVDTNVQGCTRKFFQKLLRIIHRNLFHETAGTRKGTTQDLIRGI